MKIIFLLFVIMLNILQSSACFPTAKIDIHVINNLPSKSPPLTLRCQSKDDDLGYHTLKVKQDFSWSFCENIYGRTLFFCHLWWGSKQQSFDVFKSKLFKSKFTKVPKPQYYWIAKSDGIYFSNSNTPSTFTKKYDWS
ncbi:hypothetical protein DH2020_028410 [Rehmannia glutinosa]|uniref:S-protein homolog n=1 Tax=Rehmannia glutinosa TaxID=99300 RepID=A0ABR0VRG6_REHGL